MPAWGATPRLAWVAAATTSATPSYWRTPGTSRRRSTPTPPTDAFITRKLWGVASEPPFLHHGRATLFTEAILAHGGEAQAARDAFAALGASDRSSVVEFLKSLRILPAGATALVVDEPGRPR
jgi:hypothetical protein